MKLFGLYVVTRKQKKIDDFNTSILAKDEALREIVELLKQKDKIYLEKVILKGNGQTIKDCVFLGLSNDAMLEISKEDE